MKKLFMAAAVCSTVLLFSCSSTDTSNPKAVLTSFFEALAKKDISAARKLATPESKDMLDMMETAMKFPGADKKDDKKYDKSKMEFGEPVIEGDKATIAVKEKESGETTNYTLKKDGSGWKVAFDKASMMNMGGDKMKDKGMDNMNENMDHIKESADSLTNELHKMTDSIH